MATSLISVIIPTYNRKEVLFHAVQSVLDQSYKSFELIIVDDGSTDSTEKMISTIDDARIRYFKINRSGVSIARNKGVSASSGDFIAFLDSDDVWHREKLHRQVEFHRENPGLAISQTQEIWIRNGKRVNPRHKHVKPAGYIFPDSLHLCTITPSSVFMTKALFEKFAGFDEKMSACEDYDLWLRITPTHDVGLINDLLLTKYGGHDDQLSQLYPAMDRFRIYSLGKILLSGYLSSSQYKLATDVFKRKVTILLNGMQKRIPDQTSLLKGIRNLSELQLPLEEFKRQSEVFLLANRYVN